MTPESLGCTDVHLTQVTQLSTLNFLLLFLLLFFMNVLVYSGKGTTAESVKHAIESLRLHLSPHYAVVSVSETALLNDPWMSKTAVLVIPGGADLPYCDVLNGRGNDRIRQFVRNGGKFIGFCAGGYYAASRCEFEVGDPAMEVSGSRELRFFPGIARGCVYRGFVYESHQGCRAARLAVDVAKFRDVAETETTESVARLVQAGNTSKPATASTTKSEPESAANSSITVPSSVTNYYNGGGMFIGASKYPNVDVLARYTGPTDVADADMAAVVHCKVGKGDVLLCGTHPEFSPSLLRPSDSDTHFQHVVAELESGEADRRRFLGLCLARIGLQASIDVAGVPRATPIYMTSAEPHAAVKVLKDLRENMDMVGDRFEDAHDTFVLHGETEMVDSMLEDEGLSNEDAPKHIQVFTSRIPDSTPHFNMKAYFDHLLRLHNANGISSTGESIAFGSLLCYGEVVTSTNTLLDANPAWLRYLPEGLAFTATTQTSGRGRGGNVWINPQGVMATSILFKIAAGATQTLAIVTLQYLCSLALIEAVLGYGSDVQGVGSGYEDMPVRLKWPNDMYALKPEFFEDFSDKNDTSATVDDDARWAKISGALINSQFLHGQFHLVWGGGVNVSNLAPTTSLNLVLAKLNEIRAKKNMPPLPPYKHELLLAKLVFTMGQFYSVFRHLGLAPFLPLYYKRWFHLDQRVMLDAAGDGRTRDCVIKGITPDYGLLVAEDVANHEVLELQPDGNSFDIFKGLVYKKRA